MVVLTTERLRLRQLTLSDAAVVIELLNDPGFLANVGDRGVRTTADAERYIAERFVRSYREHGFGLYLVELKETGEVVGMCGLVQRDYLDLPDIGFSLLQRFSRRGYTFEAGSAVLDWARNTLHLPRVVAVTRRTNIAAQRLLEKLGLRLDRPIEVPGSSAEWVLFC